MTRYIKKYNESYRLGLINLWEKSVSASHHFLTNEEIDYYKSLVLPLILINLMYILYLNDEDRLIGFVGVAAQKTEMLFF